MKMQKCKENFELRNVTDRGSGIDCKESYSINDVASAWRCCFEKFLTTTQTIQESTTPSYNNESEAHNNASNALIYASIAAVGVIIIAGGAICRYYRYKRKQPGQEPHQPAVHYQSRSSGIDASFTSEPSTSTSADLEKEFLRLTREETKTPEEHRKLHDLKKMITEERLCQLLQDTPTTHRSSEQQSSPARTSFRYNSEHSNESLAINITSLEQSTSSNQNVSPYAVSPPIYASINKNKSLTQPSPDRTSSGYKSNKSSKRETSYTSLEQSTSSSQSASPAAHVLHTTPTRSKSQHSHYTEKTTQPMTPHQDDESIYEDMGLPSYDEVPPSMGPQLKENLYEYDQPWDSNIRDKIEERCSSPPPPSAKAAEEKICSHLAGRKNKNAQAPSTSFLNASVAESFDSEQSI